MRRRPCCTSHELYNLKYIPNQVVYRVVVYRVVRCQSFPEESSSLLTYNRTRTYRRKPSGIGIRGATIRLSLFKCMPVGKASKLSRPIARLTNVSGLFPYDVLVSLGLPLVFLPTTSEWRQGKARQGQAKQGKAGQGVAVLPTTAAMMAVTVVAAMVVV